MRCLHMTQILNHYTQTYILVSHCYMVCMIISKKHNQHKHNTFNILNYFYPQILEFSIYSTSAKSYLFSCWEGFAGGWAGDSCAGFGLLSLFLQEKFPGELKSLVYQLCWQDLWASGVRTDPLRVCWEWRGDPECCFALSWPDVPCASQVLVLPRPLMEDPGPGPGVLFLKTLPGLAS